MKWSSLRLITLAIAITCSAHLSLAELSKNWLMAEYREALIAQSSGTYTDLLSKWTAEPTFLASIESTLETELDEIKNLDPQARKAVISNILYYYSTKHQSLKGSAFQLPSRISYSEQELSGGTYDSRKLAQEMVSGASHYIEASLAPLFDSIIAEIRRDFPTQYLVFLGRDFTGAYAYFVHGHPTEAARSFSLNVSRAIRDLSISGQSAEMRAVFSQIGLTAEMAAERGIVFFDSSMKGRIPRSILSAWTEVLDDAQSTQLLLKSDLRYIRSKKLPGQTMPNYVRTYLAQNSTTGVLDRGSIQTILANDYPIERFAIDLPASHAAWDPEHIHNLFEHLPKFLKASETFKRLPNGKWILESSAPSSPQERVLSLLGLAADLTVFRLSSKPFEHHPVGLPRNYLVDPEVSQRMSEIEIAFKGGYRGMKAWQDQGVLPGADTALARVQLKETGDSIYPFALEENGIPVVRLRSFLGEGRNVVVYLTEHGTVLKLLKDAKNATKIFLQTWAGPVIESYGIKIAKVLDVHPKGIWMIQEAVPGESLEMTCGGTLKGLPKSIETQVLRDWKRAQKLATEKDIWLDYKSANCHVDSHGEVVFVDYAPRLNKGYRRYYESDDGQPLSKSGFLTEFLYRQIRDGKTFVSPPGVDCEALLLQLNEKQGES